ncbi:hypothetical protein [Pseudoalteromonas citrea]|nr:hypothetical protein [Pseudoalteromonas citrea]
MDPDLRQEDKVRRYSGQAMSVTPLNVVAQSLVQSLYPLWSFDLDGS